jgi:hypothetical protein
MRLPRGRHLGVGRALSEDIGHVRLRSTKCVRACVCVCGRVYAGRFVRGCPGADQEFL